MHLYFIRHGESTSNYGDLITGQQDVPLTNLGRLQALAAGQTIAAQGITIDHIICSHLMRAHDTAKIIAKEIGFPEDKIQVNDLVIERSFGALEGQPKMNPAKLDDDLIKASGGELDPQIRERAQKLLDSLKGTTGNVLIVSHTGFGRRLRAVIEEIPTQYSHNFKNAHLTDLGEIR
ncbi:MAG: histidine phosphatase family protein [Candidatus Microsaccharimonas sossegonensis]|uniref:Histidine phosphatase family protein n=1 Tax=Candidatus Microsaccharimonas sossegonensis TaxID=2506948 RepID=A0A4Q0AHP2_9BACT|nr:MAG: histidine phosphatase family protein [Candidatus Microsaccharimonas sossegonensis]